MTSKTKLERIREVLDRRDPYNPDADLNACGEIEWILDEPGEAITRLLDGAQDLGQTLENAPETPE